MRVILYKVGELPVVIEIDGSLESLQALVGGYIESLRIFPDDRLSLYCNEEGKILGLPPNRGVLNGDVIMGDFFVARHDDEGEMIDITEADVLRLKVAS